MGKQDPRDVGLRDPDQRLRACRLDAFQEGAEAHPGVDHHRDGAEPQEAVEESDEGNSGGHHHQDEFPARHAAAFQGARVSAGRRVERRIGNSRPAASPVRRDDGVTAGRLACRVREQVGDVQDAKSRIRAITPSGSSSMR